MVGPAGVQADVLAGGWTGALVHFLSHFLLHPWAMVGCSHAVSLAQSCSQDDYLAFSRKCLITQVRGAMCAC